jgi:hypothetical protein
VDAKLIQLVVALIELGLEVYPTLERTVKLARRLLETGASPTPEEQAEIAAALDAAHDKLQTQLTLRLK